METEILTKRPSGMDFQKYRAELKAQQKTIKRYLREGRLCFVSWKTTKVENDSLGNKGELLISRNPNPFRGSTKGLKFV